MLSRDDGRGHSSQHCMGIKRGVWHLSKVYHHDCDNTYQALLPCIFLLAHVGESPGMRLQLLHIQPLTEYQQWTLEALDTQLHVCIYMVSKAHTCIRLVFPLQGLWFESW